MSLDPKWKNFLKLFLKKWLKVSSHFYGLDHGASLSLSHVEGLGCF